MRRTVKRFLKEERGDSVVWIVVVIICVIIAVTAYKYMGGGVANASKSMGNALSGQ